MKQLSKLTLIPLIAAAAMLGACGEKANETGDPDIGAQPNVATQTGAGNSETGATGGTATSPGMGDTATTPGVSGAGAGSPTTSIGTTGTEGTTGTGTVTTDARTPPQSDTTR